MPKLCANISFLWKDLPVPNRIKAAAAAGFDGVEILFPYDTPVPELKRALDQTGLQLALINCPPPNYTGGERGFAAVPGLEDRFRTDFRRALRYAQALGARRIHIMAGPGEGPEAEACFVRNLQWACDFAPDQLLTIEPINPHDMPGYYLNDFDLADRVLRAVRRANLGLQYDAYHAQRITGDALACWEAHGAFVHHIQIGDHPGRHEPGSGDIDYRALFAAFEAGGYQDWVSAEYIPSGEVEMGLGWMDWVSRD
ncbi:hydroxypyruvate isomerase family protein [Pseudooceanicola sp.]|uniref:hydroxypyruvate isomerase family protein n=1 Tax=Pseudooceanicola sp. TaxID=1914328 RepID=UPI0035C77750